LFHDNEEGTFTFVNVVAVMLCALLIGLIINVGQITQQKIDMQNTADAAAYSAAVWQARGMNAITATNHVIGEMMAFVVVHEAIGGARLDHPEMGPADTRELDDELDRAAAIAQGLGARTDAHETVRQRGGIHADRTLLDAKKTLKELLTEVYRTKAAARIMQLSIIPAVVAAGEALEAAMDALEWQIQTEYELLKLWHKAAFALRGHKRVLRDEMVPDAVKYTRDIREKIPDVIRDTVRLIAEKQGCQGTVYPTNARLPVVLDPFRRAMMPVFPESEYVKTRQQPCGCPTEQATNMRRQIVKTTQLVRATWPWVNYHRYPILRVLKAAVPLSKAGDFYFGHTAGATLDLLGQYQIDNRDLGLLVMKGYPAPDKGYELWTEDPVKADNLFTLLGMVYRDPPRLLGESRVFRQAHSDGRVALAQAMIYNANEQERPKQRIDLSCKRILPIRQANAGWDTLNWAESSRQGTESCADISNGGPNADNDPAENRPYEITGKGIHPEYPRICVNWQAKLVPVTRNRLEQAQADAESQYRKVLQRLSTQPNFLRTH
jgi:hypothetical protein